MADLLGIHRGVYHSAMEEGGCDMHLLKLSALEEAGEPLAQVALHSCQYLAPGLGILASRFGGQPKIENARAKVFTYMSLG